MKTQKTLKLVGSAFLITLSLAATAQPSLASECRFGRESCRGQMVGRLWVETFDLTHADGKPTPFHAGDAIARIAQDTNGYAGYHLKRVGFLVARDSFSKPRIGVFVNDQRVGEREITSHGSVFTGFNAEPVAVDVDDCPLNFYAIVQKGTVEAYSVNFYWEDPRGGWDGSLEERPDHHGEYPEFHGGEHGHIVIGKEPSREIGEPRRLDLVGILDHLLFNLERIRDLMTPEQYGSTVEPMIVPARKMRAEVRACGPICAQATAATLIADEDAGDAFLQELMTAPAVSRYADGILTDVEKIRAFYGITSAQK